MGKYFKWIVTLLITILTLSILGNTVLADEKVYDNIKDGEYKIKAKALHATEDKPSGAASFINEDVDLSIKDGEVELTITIPHKDIAEVTGLQIDQLQPKVEEDDKAKYKTYKLSNLKTELNARVQYEVPSMGMMDQDEPLRLILEDLDKLPAVEEPNKDDEDNQEPEDNNDGEETENSDENDLDDGNEGESGKSEDDDDGSNDNGSEDEGDFIENPDKTYEMEYITDSTATQRNFNNPVTLLVKDGKKYIQMSGTGGQFITLLTVNGTEVTWGKTDDEGNFVIQFELPGAPSDEIEFGMVISPPGMDDMNHTVPLSFGKRVEPNKSIDINSGEVILINNTQLTMPKLPKNATVTITPRDKAKNQGNLEIAGDIYEFDFVNIGKNPGTFELVMGYDQEKYNSDDYNVDIYYYDVDKDKWIPQKGEVKDGKITIQTDHFSTYGVFAQKVEEKPKEGPKEEPKEDPKEEPETPGADDKESALIPDKAYEIDYVIKHAIEDRASAADGFFKKPATLLYKNGQKYVQLTVTNSDMINSLSTANGDVLIVEKNKDGSMVVQFKVDGNLSDVIDLNMFITVPGVYDNQEHDARLFLNEGSMKKDDATNYLLVAGSKGNKNGPIIEDVEPGETIPKEDPEKPEFGPGNDNGNGNDSDENTEKLEKEKGENPQTGDTTSILLYAMLLIGSLIPLAVKLRRRFI